MAGSNDIAPPLWLLLELTYSCPLHCVFCFNPTNYTGVGKELTTAQWVDVMRQARALGAAQIGFSGGEPMNRDDLEELVQEAHALGFYTNLLKVLSIYRTHYAISGIRQVDGKMNPPIGEVKIFSLHI